MALLESLKSALKFADHAGVTAPPKAGVYHFLREEPQEKVRAHLRVNPDGSGLLLVNAARVYHFNPSATFMAYLALNRTPRPQALKSLARAFNAPRETLAADYDQVAVQVEGLLAPDGPCPVHELDLDILPPFSVRPNAPYRMDLALTYQCNNACSHCYNARERSFSQLSTPEWFKVLDLLWELGIPHIVFTGGEPTLRPDLPDLIAHAEHNGQITGINTNGRRLKDAEFVKRLAGAGLDHVQITLESHVPEIHDELVAHPGAWQETVAGLRNVLETHLYVMTNTTLLKRNSPHLAGTLDFLAENGVPTLGINALIYSGRGETVGTGLAESDLPALLSLAQERTQAHHQRLIWYTPTQYCHFDPMALELGVKGCTAALYNMCIEPDGSVLPCQSYYQPLGNLLKDPWDSIWNHELAVSLRERKGLPEDCLSCQLLPDCGGGCPLAQTHQQPVKPVLTIHS
ncbi:radical SAM additional 4Fe4S-binding SPASM domain [Longilinea arvoryzae]|uniref:Radical SAM additional 4Fe4S-binding SPASM domain n=1 Tax=Longilinea arvoryzae TaxID=360412 RepID=A0A0S7BA64_9CHLR|nr:radical SAM protein [Longilinea arvoryzae]GAP14476.1 radical SAM additional 4Fe4S-binding SPASM domain [Longilinea arvoryzae]